MAAIVPLMKSVTKLFSRSVAGILWSFAASSMADPANFAWLNSPFQDKPRWATNAGQWAFYESTLDGGSSPIVISLTLGNPAAFNGFGVKGLYRDSLGGASRLAELASSIDGLLGGWRDEQVMSSLLGLPGGLVPRAGGNDTLLVNQLDEELLAHPADPSALSSCVPMPDGSANANGQLGSVVFSSPEYRTSFVGGPDDQNPDHHADPVRRAPFFNDLPSRATPDQLRAGVFASPEFFALAPGVPEPRATALFLAGGTGLLVLLRRRKIASSE